MSGAAKRPVTLTAEDWSEIYYALESKRKSDTTLGDNGWRRHLRDISDAIGPDGVRAADNGVSPVRS